MTWNAVLRRIEARTAVERDPGARGWLALAIGRLPYRSAEEIERARAWLLMLEPGLQGESLVDLARGMAMLARLTGRRVPLGAEFLSRSHAILSRPDADPRVRRALLGVLIVAQATTPSELEASLQSADPQLRRIAVSGLARLDSTELRDRLQQLALRDSVGAVRYEALGAVARNAGSRACPVLVALARDSMATVALRALDLLGEHCGGDGSAVPTLETALTQRDDWHASAHALVSLARILPSGAHAALPEAVADRVWQRRMYAARAAALLRDSATLRQLADDSVLNVREAALTGLHDVTGHADDARYRAALGTADYQLVLTAARALAGSPEPRPAVEALVTALERITRQRRETSRDPRVAILVRLRELGSVELTPRLVPLLHDFDPVIADSAAVLLNSWTGRVVLPSPRPLQPEAVVFAELRALRGARLRFIMASGKSFDVTLLADAAPLTVVRVARLAARGYYNGLSFHRVVPNFVIQGGSPGANEYAGQPEFMRDELGHLSHERGTLGISTRGRDTGDAQLFINLQDNPRLDYDYTVWGRVVSGMDVVDAVGEGEVIRRVEIRSR
jgi:cyclophilin family peptidyl-prolyl cis-trans isomerase/HEAT repeat protein